ncbi:MAG: PIG-L family deacetylase [Candidatus Tectomicrobia bacterium]|nr:PIG-L family deacetylase [Candidatus Tectomicrobia bacterium]
MNILAIGAHPDDIEFGCGGTLLRYAEEGHNVYLFVLTRGSEGGSARVRSAEQKKAAGALGAKELFFGDHEDTRLPVDKDLISEVERLVRKVQPETVFVHFGQDTHQDHRNLSSAVVSAARFAPTVLFYEGPSTQNFSPSVFVDIASTFERKLSALKAHASQVTRTKVKDLTIIEVARATAHFRGTQTHIQLAEGFVPLRMLQVIPTLARTGL